MPDELMTYEAMRLGRQFTPLEFGVDAGMLQAFGKIVGGEPSTAPIGLLAIFARRAYLTDGVMPSGGVMASLDVQYLSALPVGRPLVAAATVSQRQVRKDRGWVTIDIAFTDQGKTFARATVLGVWPL